MTKKKISLKEFQESDKKGAWVFPRNSEEFRLYKENQDYLRNEMEINHCSEHECPGNNKRGACRIQICILIDPKKAAEEILTLDSFSVEKERER
ncbi:MAG: hypothetical protein ACFE9L_11985 [Candidatus Hodarchaeota archaeon]